MFFSFLLHLCIYKAWKRFQPYTLLSQLFLISLIMCSEKTKQAKYQINQKYEFHSDSDTGTRLKG